MHYANKYVDAALGVTSSLMTKACDDVNCITRCIGVTAQQLVSNCLSLLLLIRHYEESTAVESATGIVVITFRDSYIYINIIRGELSRVS
jgi:hypothetical protein